MVAVAYADMRDEVPTPAHTLGDDSLLIKYINPRLFAFATLSNKAKQEVGPEKVDGDVGPPKDKGQELTVRARCVFLKFSIGIRRRKYTNTAAQIRETLSCFLLHSRVYEARWEFDLLFGRTEEELALSGVIRILRCCRAV